MQHRTWFTSDRTGGTAIAIVMDEIPVTLQPSGMVDVEGLLGASMTVDFDDAVVLVAALSEAVEILRSRGTSERPDVLVWLHEHAS
ncbi:hypothetical protein DEJ01_09850 [Curtobacterium sp. MCLR17_040]|uniref:hypothetical protein n=1 Tax=Curtobacterium sp. MCLR17_040 TaxID=2175625 RepID=UPI000DA7C6BE|nr:hypothetical protein [Curtobacterium sp. MCLR17_040]PZF02820.1 hypothetical protein DEJ01_09850 [Curtobacterium sp. MCLR17_040]